MYYLDLIDTPISIRGLTLPNRVIVPPINTFAANPEDRGLANDEHLVHYGGLADGGYGLIIVESTSVSPNGYTTPTSLALYDDTHIAPLAKIVDYIHSKTISKVAIQLVHTGRKGCVWDPFAPLPQLTPQDPYGYECVGPSSLPHHPTRTQVPRELTKTEIDSLICDFQSAARRAITAGFDAIELHGAHGYLLHQFVSPISNTRTDEYGGCLANRLRFPLQVTEAVRSVMPDTMPLIMRLSCTDWVDGGTTIEDSIHFANELEKRGVDIIHCSGGGVAYDQVMPRGTEFRIRLAEEMRCNLDLMVIGVGSVETYEEARQLLEDYKTDLVSVGRAVLRNPMWLRNGIAKEDLRPWVPARHEAGFFGLGSGRKQSCWDELSDAGIKGVISLTDEGGLGI
eukprot:Blabericola_migrator_1__5440@NODE_2781_length_2363_cov_138_385889_g1743_i0_p1_GENE_NODE_2781_length_2363_cov_138_385889_g1743_i0NODE_2781_length_2363_cov_138_385889_g1743_i0_p1_ORF_typecomplete_len397_score51_20Oxidored_FMN/PF00724_20/2e97Dus/PF01207_17/1_2e08DHO_dh/PF01180_21/0_22DUF561/PF04481_12/0_16_NODE_2781_length_2363_cov_138_385889_g1743_i09632153